MSRIGRRPIPVPAGVNVRVADGEIEVKGAKGTLTRSICPDLGIEIAEGELTVTRPSDSKEHRSLHGLTRTLIANMVEGVVNGYQRRLDIVGVGFRAQLAGKNLSLAVGHSHGIEIPPPAGIEFDAQIDPQSRSPYILVKGIDKELVGQVAAQIRRLRKPEPYKGKGIRYQGEQVRRKAGKSGKAGGKK